MNCMFCVDRSEYIKKMTHKVIREILGKQKLCTMALLLLLLLTAFFSFFLCCFVLIRRELRHIYYLNVYAAWMNVPHLGILLLFFVIFVLSFGTVHFKKLT